MHGATVYGPNERWSEWLPDGPAAVEAVASTETVFDRLLRQYAQGAAPGDLTRPNNAAAIDVTGAERGALIEIGEGF
jgi:hypothetical protein